VKRLGLFLGVVLLWGAGLASLRAQNSEFATRPGELPPGRLLASPPNPSAWRVIVLGGAEIAERNQRVQPKELAAKRGQDSEGRTQVGPQASLEPLPQPPGSEWDIVAAHHIYSGNLHWTDTQMRRGDRRKQLILGDYLLYENPFRDQVIVISPERAAAEGESYQAGRLEGFGWISRQNYKGVTIFEGRECDVFQLTAANPEPRQADPIRALDASFGLETAEVAASSPPSSPPASARVLQTALIDRASRLPVLLEDVHSIQIYEFLPTPPPLELPQRYRDALTKHYEQSKSRERRYKVPQ